MRTLLTVVVLLSLVAIPARAQRTVPDRSPAASPQQIFEFLLPRLYKGISLTKDETSKVKEILDRSLAEQQTLDFSAADWRERRTAILEKRNAAFRALLSSDDEKAKFDINLKSM